MTPEEKKAAATAKSEALHKAIQDLAVDESEGFLLNSFALVTEWLTPENELALRLNVTPGQPYWRTDGLLIAGNSDNWVSPEYDEDDD